MKGKGLWILGARNKWMSQFKASPPRGVEFQDDTWIINGQKFHTAEHSIVLTAKHPDNPDLSWTLIHVSNIDDLPGIGRKLPHSGK